MFATGYGKLRIVDEQYVFFPPNRSGVIFHLAANAILITVAAWGFWQATQSNIGPTFLLYLIPLIAALPLVPLLIYRLNSLQNASYTLERDSIRLRWGLRTEVIPMVNVQWVKLATDLGGALSLPPLRWPGAILGTRRYPGGHTVIEYMASEKRRMLVIATSEKLFAISPANVDNFLQAYQHFTEMGSLLPPSARSVYPTVMVSRLWGARPARSLIILGMILSFSTLAWVSFTLPEIEQVSLGFTPSVTPREAIPGIRLMILPVLNVFIFLFNLFLGIVLFRRPESQILAYLLWGTSIFVSILFLIAIYFILQIA